LRILASMKASAVQTAFREYGMFTSAYT